MPTATLADAIGDDGVVLAVASSAWKTGSDNTFRLVIGYDPTLSRHVGASVDGGTVAASVSEDGRLGTLTIT